MPSSYTEHGLVLQAPGENENTWGDINNQNVIELIDDGIFGRAAFSLSGPRTLSNTAGVASEARNAILHATSGAGGTLTIPTLSKLYMVINDTSGDVVITAGGVTATVKATERNMVVCDGANVYPLGVAAKSWRDYVADTAFEMAAGSLPDQTGNDGKALTTHGGVAGWDNSLVAPTITGGATVAGGIVVAGGATVSGSTKANVQAAAAANFDLSAADLFTKAISASTTFTFSNATASKAQAFVVELTISSGAIATWPASVQWGGGAPPILANGRHVLGFVTFNGGTVWTGIRSALNIA
jgi:hypothetical protein